MFLAKVESAVTKAKRLNGVKKSGKDKASEAVPEATNFMAIKAALKNKALSRALNSAVVSAKATPQDLKALLHEVAPGLVSAILVDLDIIKKSQQSALSRRLAQVITKK